MSHLRANLLLLGLTLGVCGVAYPLALWAVGQAVFPGRANGSLLTAKGSDGADRVVGSGLIAQPFGGDEYFWPRPSAASYNSASSSGSNFGPHEPKREQQTSRFPVDAPADLRYSSGSGLDPDITPASALYQVSGWPPSATWRPVRWNSWCGPRFRAKRLESWAMSGLTCWI